MGAGLDEWAKIVGIVKDTTLTGATLATAVVAVKGINRWRQEHAGKAEYELARRMLLSVYRLRDAIASLRRPGMSSAEYGSREGRAGESPGRQRANDLRHAYHKRWEVVHAARSQFDADFLESEALWGPLLSGSRQFVDEATTRLWVSIQLLADHEIDDANRLAKEDLAKAKADVYRGSRDDLIEVLLQRAIGGFEFHLRPKLKR